MSMKDRFDETVRRIVGGELDLHRKGSHNLFIQDGEFKFSDPITIGYNALLRLILDELDMDLNYIPSIPPKIELVKKTNEN